MTCPVSLGVSPTAASTPSGVFNQRSEALFPRAGALGCTVCFGPPGLSMLKCGAMGSARCRTACPVLPQSAMSLGPACCREYSLPQLPISAPPAGLDESFFFISLVVGLPCGLIFCQFWLFFVFKLLLSFFWLYEEVQCIYLCLHLGQNS